jgi:hypothetical protein
MAEDIGQWIGAQPEWLQLVAIPLFLVLALLFVPIAGGGDTLGMMIIDFITRKTGVNDGKK